MRTNVLDILRYRLSGHICKMSGPPVTFDILGSFISVRDDPGIR